MIIDSPIVSGSQLASGPLTQIGNVEITGSLSVTGTINGSITGSITSASYATNAEFLDRLDSTSFVFTSSFNTFSGSAAGRITNLEAFSSSLDATFATDASVSASILVLSQSVQASEAALSSSYTTTSGSYASASGSLSIRTTNLEATSSTLVAASSSFAADSASLSTRLTGDEANITTLTLASGSFAAQSASLSTRITQDETNFTNLSSSFATTSGSLSTRVANLESTSSTVSSSFASTSGSISGRVTLIEGQYATTGSNVFTGPQFINQASNAIGFASTASLYTDGGLRVSKDSFVSGTAYFNNVVVYGTSSIQYITSSQVNFGTNIITVNTDTPAVRFGGLAVFDSGSTQLTGSMLWDSERNYWIYSNPSGSTYNSGMIMSGPRNSGSLGSEQGTTSCALMMGQGGDHITSSMIYSYGNATCFYGQSYISSSGAACFAGAICVGGGLVAQQASVFCDTVGLFGASPQLYIGATNGASNYTILKWCTTDKSLNIHNQSTGGSTQLVIACNGNVGVKTIAAPSYDLEVRGNIGVLSSTSAGLITTSTLCAAGTITGLVRFDGLHSPSLTTYTGPSISACKDDANYTTSLVFKTTDGSGINNTNLRITGAGVACFAGTVCAPAAIFSGCVGIGTTSPTTTLHVRTDTGVLIRGASSDSDAILSFLPASGGRQYNFRNYGSSFGIQDASADTIRMYFNFNGNTGIGTTSPSTKLDVYAGADATSNLILWGQTIRNEGNGAATGYGAGLKLKISSDGTPNEVYKWAGVAAVAGTGYSNRTDLALYSNTASTANATEKVRITGDGCVGIGTTTPGTTLDVIGTIRTDGTSNGIYLRNTLTGVIRNPTPGDRTIAFETNAEYMRITATGNIGIGTCAPNEKLTVWTPSTTGLQTALRLNNPFGFNNLNTGTQIVFSQDRSVSEDLKQGIIAVGQADAGTSATSFMAFYTNSSGLGERLRITSIGRVGILTNDPKGLFEVGMTCAKTTFGGLLFNTLSVADSNWFCFFEPPGNWAGLTTMNWVAPNDFNRSGTAQVRWSYQNCSAALGPTTSIFNDSQNATATFRYAGGYLQACITGAGAGYNVQFTILGARGA